MGRGPIPMRRPKLPFLKAITARSTFGISPSFLGLSQSSGQVTHVLLTRSRLCPRASPGSSLHLHVLSTPPAFVLSQDQTLHEELLLKSCHGFNAKPVHRPRTMTGHSAAVGTRERVRRRFGPGRTLRSRVDRGAHAAEFSKTAAPSEGDSFQQRGRTPKGLRPAEHQYSAPHAPSGPKIRAISPGVCPHGVRLRLRKHLD